LLSLFFPAETFGLPSSLPVEHESAAGSFLSSGAEFGPGVLRLIPPSCSLSSSAAECASCISVSLPSPIAFLVYHSRFSLGRSSAKAVYRSRDFSSREELAPGAKGFSFPVSGCAVSPFSTRTKLALGLHSDFLVFDC
jgi:hypothetical protein